MTCDEQAGAFEERVGGFRHHGLLYSAAMTLSIYDEPDAVPQTMPTKLKAVIAALALFIPYEIWWFQAMGTSARGGVRIAAVVLAVVYLARGSDRARAWVRGLSVLGALAGGVLLMQMHGLGFRFGSPLMATMAGMLAIYAFIFWALGQEDVMSWTRSRSTFSAMP